MKWKIWNHLLTVIIPLATDFIHFLKKHIEINISSFDVFNKYVTQVYENENSRAFRGQKDDESLYSRLQRMARVYLRCDPWSQ